MMKKTTRNYIWMLTANFLLLAAVAGIWQFRLKADAFDRIESGIPDVTVHHAARALPPAGYLQDMKTPADLTDLKGRWVLVNLWASWCPPCIVEMPSLGKLADTYKGRLHVVAISMDAKAEEAEKAIARHDFGAFARHWDQAGAMMKVFSPENLPMSYLIDPAGKIRATFAGQFEWNTPEMTAFFDRMLTASTSVPARP